MNFLDKDRLPRYLVLLRPNLEELADEVNEYITKGWTPQGGLVVLKGIPPDEETPQRLSYYYAQSMFLRRIEARAYPRHDP